MAGETAVTVRRAEISDLTEMQAILNEIIAVGGTTAIETPLPDAEFRNYFVDGDDLFACHVAVDPAGRIAGFQSLGRHPKLAQDWADIATFARMSPKVPGVGTALFARTRRFAEENGVSHINATIRADNTGGLAYYGKMGFIPFKTDTAVPLSSGLKIDRISKVYCLNGGDEDY